MAEQMLRKQLRGMRGDSVGVPLKPEVDPISGALRSDIERQIRLLTRRLALEIPIDATGDARVLRSKIERQLAELRQAVSLKVPTEPDGLGDYHRRLRSALDSSKVVHKVRVDVDTDTVGSTGARQATAAGSRVGSAFASGFGGILFNPLIGIPLLIAGIFSVSALAAAVASATVAGAGLAAVFLGAFLLRNDPELKAATSAFLGEVKAVFAEAVKPLKGPFLEAIGIIRDGFRDIAPDIKSFFKTIAQSGGIQELARGFAGLFKQLADTGALDKLAQAIGPILKQLGMALPDIGNAIAQFLISISKPETVASFGTLLRGLADTIRVVGGVIGYLTRQFLAVVLVIQAVGSFIGDLIAGVQLFTGVLTGNAEQTRIFQEILSNAFKAISGLWNELWNGMRTKASDTTSAVTATISQLPGKIVGALGDLGALLYNGGRNVVQGLINGIRSMFGLLGGTASEMAGVIGRRLPHSPAKEGPLSGAGSPFHSGQSIATGLAAGVQSQLPTVAGAANQLAGAFGSAGPSGGGASAGSQVATLRLDTAGSRLDQVLIEVLKIAIENGFGGDVDLAIGNGRGRFA